MLKALCLDSAGWREIDDHDSISDLIAARGQLLWAHADVLTLSEADVATIAEEFGLDALAVEDAMRLRQRPKFEAYANHLFAVMHQIDQEGDQFEARQIACFIGDGWVLTLHEASGRTIEEASKRCTLGSKEPDQGSSYIMHALLDTIVDEYEWLTDLLEQETEDIEDLVLHEPTAPVQRRLYSLKQRVSRLRRYVVPGERVLASVAVPAPGSLVTDRTAIHFRDVRDHAQRIIEQMSNIDDLLNAVIDLQRAAQANALNETTKRLTGWAAIIAVPTLIASVYGMNFRLFPRDGSATGFWFALSLMVLTGVTLFVYFKRRDWL